MTRRSHSTPNKKQGNNLAQIGLLAAVPGILIAGPLIGYFLGRWGDNSFGSEPWLVIVGVVLGFVAAGRQIWHLVKKAQALDKKSTDDNQQVL